MTPPKNQQLRTNSQRPTAILFGTFDLLHPGHVYAIDCAAEHGELTVIVTPDERVASEKGRAPLFTAEERCQMLSALRCVTSAIVGDTGSWSVIERLKPDVICVGHDQDASHPEFLKQLKQLETNPRIERLPEFRRERYASSKLKATEAAKH